MGLIANDSLHFRHHVIYFMILIIWTPHEDGDFTILQNFYGWCRTGACDG
jgi:hypothetical protein